MSAEKILPNNLVLPLQGRSAADVIFSFYDEKLYEFTYDEFASSVFKVARSLIQYSAIHDRVLLFLKPGVEFVISFFACLYTNRIAVPTVVPSTLQNMVQHQRTLGVLQDAKPTIILTVTALIPYLEKISLVHACNIIAIDHLSDNINSDFQWPTIHKNDTAFLQYTSGSTSLPKGVEITYENLLDNTEIIAKSFNFMENKKGFIWLPPYHDMGLIGGILAPILYGIDLILTSPSTFIKNPLRWLKFISEYKVNISGGPNFAYELCIKQMQRKRIKELDLSSWKIAFYGAEPINSDTLMKFYTVFKEYGFSMSAFKPCYGLAENTLLATSTLLSTAQAELIGSFDSDALKENRAIKIKNTNVVDKNIKLVCCGTVSQNHEICIVDPETHKSLEDGQIGEIWIHGKSVAKGYWQNTVDSDKTFNFALNGQDKIKKWLRTGDLGFLCEGNLYVSGRMKDIIIFQGKNYYPYDIEMLSSSVDNNLMQSVVFSIMIEDVEQLILLQEVDKKIDPINMVLLYNEIKKQLITKLDINVHKIYFVKRGVLPRTTSGKIQRYLCKEMYLSDKFEILNQEKITPKKLPQYFCNQTDESIILTYVNSTINGVDSNQYVSLGMLGLDSVQKMSLKLKLEEQYEVSLDEDSFTNECTLTQIAHLIQERRNKKINNNNSISINKTDKYKLNPSQSMQLLNHMLAPESNSQNVIRCLLLKGFVDIKLLKSAIVDVIYLNINLLSNFIHDESGSHQLVTYSFDENYIIEKDVTNLSADDINIEIFATASKPFNLVNDKLIRIGFYKLQNDQWIFLFCAHHIVIDYWSITSFMHQILDIYDKQINGNINYAKNTENISYQSNNNYLMWYETYLASQTYQDDLSFWKNYFANMQKKNNPIYKNDIIPIARLTRKISINLYNALINLSNKHGYSLYKLLIAIFHINLSLHRNNQEITLGTPVALRDWPEAVNHIGYCINILPIKYSVNISESLLDNIKRYSIEFETLLKHKYFPFNHILETIRPPRNGNKLPLCEALFVYHSNYNGERGCFGNFSKTLGISIENYLDILVEPQVDLMITLGSYHSSEMELVFDFDTASYDHRQIENFAEHYINLLEQFIDQNNVFLTVATPKIQLQNLTTDMTIPTEKVCDKLTNTKVIGEYIEMCDVLKEIWCEVLEINKISIDDNFFELGGNSLKAIKVVDQASKIFNKNINVKYLFKYQTIFELVNCIVNISDASASQPIQKLQRIPYKEGINRNIPRDSILTN